MSKFGGSFIGTTLLRSHEVLGGARSVFVKLGGVKNELVFPTHGGKLMNPFRGKAKIYAGDLFEYRTDANGENPEVYLLKTYLVKSVSGTTVELYKDGYKHVPFVGDSLMVAPAAVGGAGTEATVTAVTINAAGNWEVTLSAALTAADQDVLVEGDGAGSMMVKNINAVAPCDYDCFYDPTLASDPWSDAEYLLSPALSGLMLQAKMSPMPACVLALNQCNVKGWFKVDALAAPRA